MMLKLLQKLEKLFQRLWRGENIKQAKHPSVVHPNACCP
jgi:hypothetical protein